MDARGDSQETLRGRDHWTELRKGLWRPLEEDNLCYRSVDPSSALRLIKDISKIAGGQVIYASKPLVSSFGVGLMKSRSAGIPLVLDIDDWELGFAENKMRLSDPLRAAKFLNESLLDPLQNDSAISIGLLRGIYFKSRSDNDIGDFFFRKGSGNYRLACPGYGLPDPGKYDGRRLRESYGLPVARRSLCFSAPCVGTKVSRTW